MAATLSELRDEIACIDTMLDDLQVSIDTSIAQLCSLMINKISDPGFLETLEENRSLKVKEYRDLECLRETMVIAFNEEKNRVQLEKDHFLARSLFNLDKTANMNEQQLDRVDIHYIERLPEHQNVLKSETVYVDHTRTIHAAEMEKGVNTFRDVDDIKEGTNNDADSCTICFESFDLSGGPQLSCRHHYCPTCFSDFLCHACSDTSKFPLKCPIVDCNLELPTDPILLGISRGVSEKFITDFIPFQIEYLMKNRMYCPNKSCSIVLEKLNEEELQQWDGNEVRCPSCEWSICPKCAVSWHTGYSCEDYQALPDDVKEKDDLALLQLAKSNDWHRCPECGIMVERTIGCNYIRCKCGKGWCFRCGTPYQTDQATANNCHGEPGCQCGLFDVPPENNQPAAPAQAAVPIIPRPDLQNDARDPGFRLNLRRRYKVLNKNMKWYYQTSTCHYCERVFIDLDALSNHFNNTQAHEVYPCYGCHRTFFTHEDMEKHNRMRH